jgi:hypothetical protein
LDQQTYQKLDIYAQLDWLRENKPPDDDLDADGLNLWMDRGAELIMGFKAQHDNAFGSGENSLEFGWLGHSPDDLNEVVVYWLTIAATDVNEAIELRDDDHYAPRSPGEYWEEHFPRLGEDRDDTDCDGACRLIDVAIIFVDHCPEAEIDRIWSMIGQNLPTAFRWMEPPVFERTWARMAIRWARMSSPPREAVEALLNGLLPIQQDIVAVQLHSDLDLTEALQRAGAHLPGMDDDLGSITSLNVVFIEQDETREGTEEGRPPKLRIAVPILDHGQDPEVQVGRQPGVPLLRAVKDEDNGEE